MLGGSDVDFTPEGTAATGQGWRFGGSGDRDVVEAAQIDEETAVGGGVAGCAVAACTIVRALMRETVRGGLTADGG